MAERDTPPPKAEPPAKPPPPPPYHPDPKLITYIERSQRPDTTKRDRRH